MTQDETMLRDSLVRMRLHGLVAVWNEVRDEPWLRRLVELERNDRARRSLENRTRVAGLGRFKPLCDFDWSWPTMVDRAQVEDLMTLRFLDDAWNVVMLGPNGVGKTMLMKNVAQQALLHGKKVLCRGASDMLKDLATQESSVARARRVRAYVAPDLLCIDEVGYLSYDNTYADLLFEVVSRRYDARRPMVVTTNRGFKEWSEVFPNATCVVTLVDRLTHRCEVVKLGGESYRLKESKELAARRAEERATATATKAAAKRTGRQGPTVTTDER